jgi:hypothetical protein
MKQQPTFRKRVFSRLAVLLAAQALLIAALGILVWFDNAANRGITYTPDPTTSPLPWSTGPRVGVNVFNLHLEPDTAVVTNTLRLIDELGVTHVRMQLPWDDVEIHGWGDFEDRRNMETTGAISAWRKYDRIVDLADELGLELILRIDRAPNWASQEDRQKPAFEEGLERDGSSTGPPDNYSDYSAFVSTVVDRYRGKVRFFQLWNEPNLKNEWNWQEPDPEEFAHLLRLSYAAAKAANPDAVILFPSLAPVDGLDKRAPMTELEYLDAVYKAGAKDSFDIMSAQAYGLGQPPDEHRYLWVRSGDNWVWSRPIDTRTDVSRLVLVREVMERNGDGDKPIWVSEFGWNSAPESIPEERRTVWGEPVSEEQKATYLIDQIERARNEWPWVGVMNVWVFRYGGSQEPHPDDPTPYFSLVTRDWEKLPAYDALQTSLEQPFVAGVGVYEWDTPAVQTVHSTSGDTKGDIVGWDIFFQGSEVRLVGVEGDMGGEIEAMIDGDPVTLQPETLTTGEVSLKTPPQSEDDPHKLSIRMADGAPIADTSQETFSQPSRFVVSRTPPMPWVWYTVPTMVVIGIAALSIPTIRALYEAMDIIFATIKRGARWVLVKITRMR